jgi:hypothetical protein
MLRNHLRALLTLLLLTIGGAGPLLGTSGSVEAAWDACRPQAGRYTPDVCQPLLARRDGPRLPII